MNVLKLRAKIIENGFKTKEFQMQSGIPQNTFYRAIRGDGELKESQIQKICEMLDCDVKELFFNGKVTKPTTIDYQRTAP